MYVCTSMCNQSIYNYMYIYLLAKVKCTARQRQRQTSVLYTKSNIIIKTVVQYFLSVVSLIVIPNDSKRRRSHRDNRGVLVIDVKLV